MDLCGFRVMPSLSFVARSSAALCLMLLALPATVSAADDAAHRLADKFATGDRAAREAADAERRAAEESEMLERARREAAERAQADRAAEAAAEARMKEMEAAREAEAKRLAEKLRRAGDARRQRAASESRSTDAFKPALKPASPPVPAVSPPAMAREPEPDIARDLEPNGAPFDEPPAQTAGTPPLLPSPPMSLGRHEPEFAPPADRRVTVLLVMEPGKKGIRRFNKTADPVLCHDELCFVSKGAAAPARVMTRRKALGAGNTLGKRAGACRHSLTCAYRGVTLDGPAPVIEPVDLKILVHDRREPRAVSGDASCHVTAGRLSCGRTVVAAGYRAWIVPEAIAEQAGPAGLAAALARGLQPVDLREAAFRD